VSLSLRLACCYLFAFASFLSSSRTVILASENLRIKVWNCSATYIKETAESNTILKDKKVYEDKKGILSIV